MRAIKFKAQRVSDGEWVEGSYIRLVVYGVMKHFILPANGLMFDDVLLKDILIEIDPNTLCQFTGLTDKNGKEVYEGDILYTKYNDVNEELGYYELESEVSFQFGSYGFIGEITGEFLPFSIYPITTEIVIGNIHDK